MSRTANLKAIQPSEYVEDMLRWQKAIAIMPEVPLSPGGWPLNLDNDSQQERIRALRRRVQDAWVAADGNPADGRWIFLTRLLRLGATSGQSGRWIGARTDVMPAEELPDLRWINARTESEWIEWENRYDEEKHLKDKVESWKRKVEAHGSSLETPAITETSAVLQLAAEPHATAGHLDSTPQHSVRPSKKIATMKTTSAKPKTTPSASSLADPLKDSAPFGFSVVKRPATQKTTTGKPSVPGNSGKSKPSNKEPDAETNTSAAGAGKKGDKADILPASTRNTNIQHISDISEMSFLPPSFQSSVIMTSTPKPPSTARKPAPIAPLPISSSSVLSLSSSLPLPPAPKTPVAPAASLPAIPFPSTPPRKTHPNQLTPNANNNKRALPASPVTPNDESRAIKKARTLPALVRSPRNATKPTDTAAVRRALERQLIGRTFQTPRTPESLQRPASQAQVIPKNGVPGAAPPPALSSSPVAVAAPATPKKHALPTLTDLLASSKKDKASASRKLSKGKERQRPPPAADVQPKQPSVLEITDDSVFPAEPSYPSFPANPIPRRDPYADNADFDDIVTEDHNPYIFDPYAVDYASPTKSLSSLAGSDSEDDDIEDAEEKGLGAPPPPAGGFNMDLSPGFAFRPPVTSTQQPRRGPQGSQLSHDSWASVYGGGSNPNQGASMPKSSQGFPMYNSQLNSHVAQQVDKVDKLLEMDVNVDYRGWLKDPSEEPGAAAGVEESP